MLDFLGHRDAHDAIIRAIETVLDPVERRAPHPGSRGKASTGDLGRAIADAVRRPRLP
jgi:tartrate dehydrogenase/decarboxylase/D-malate dehydrogenase